MTCNYRQPKTVYDLVISRSLGKGQGEWENLGSGTNSAHSTLGGLKASVQSVKYRETHSLEKMKRKEGDV